MIKKIVIILITTLTLTANVNASSDGELLLKKNNPANVKDCWEGFNRVTFALNQGLMENPELGGVQPQAQPHIHDENCGHETEE